MEERSFIESNSRPQENLGTEDIRKPGLMQVCILYSTAIILFLIIGSRVQKNEFYSGILITEFVLILLPPIILLASYKYDLKSVLRLNKVSAINILLIFGLMVFALPLVGALNLANLIAIKSIFGRIIVQQVPVARDEMGLLINILVIGGSAGICEEVLFRGTILRGLERLGTAKAILITAFLFGLMHADFQRLLGTFLLGALIGFIVYRSNSLFSGMFAHFANNSIAVIISYLSYKFTDMAKKSGIEGIDSQGAQNLDLSVFATLPRPQLIAVIIVWTFLILFAAIVFCLLLFAFIRATKKVTAGSTEYRNRDGYRGLLWLIPGLIPVGFIYYAQGLMLRGTNSELVNSILKSIGLK